MAADAARPRPPDAAGAARAAAPRNVQVKIVWDGIDRRITQLTRMPGSVTYVVPSPDSRTYLFSAMGGARRRCRRSRRPDPACTPSPRTARASRA